MDCVGLGLQITERIAKQCITAELKYVALP